MPWNLKKSGVKADVITAVNQLTGSTHPGQTDQINRLIPTILSEIAAIPAAKVNARLEGHFDGKVSVTTIRIEAIETDTNGQIFSKS